MFFIHFDESVKWANNSKSSWLISSRCINSHYGNVGTKEKVDNIETKNYKPFISGLDRMPFEFIPKFDPDYFQQQEFSKSDRSDFD